MSHQLFSKLFTKHQLPSCLPFRITLVHPNERSIADCCLEEVIPERLPSAIIPSVCAVISANLVGSIHTIHKVIVHINKIGNFKAFERLISECLSDPFVLFVWSFS